MRAMKATESTACMTGEHSPEVLNKDGYLRKNMNTSEYIQHGCTAGRQIRFDAVLV